MSASGLKMSQKFSLKSQISFNVISTYTVLLIKDLLRSKAVLLESLHKKFRFNRMFRNNGRKCASKGLPLNRDSSVLAFKMVLRKSDPLCDVAA